MNTEHTQLPAEVREAIGRIVYHRPTTNALCAALAPLWPKPAPIPSDAEVAAAVERLEAECFPDEKHRCGTMAAAIRTVLAALKHQHQCLERLHPYGREEIAELQSKLAEAQSALRFASELTAQKDAEIARLTERLAAAQEALREIAAAAAPLVKIGIPAYSSQDDCRYQVPFYDCPDDLVLYQDGMGGSITVGAVRALRAAIDAARAKEARR